MLSLKPVVPVRLIKNAFQVRVAEAEAQGASREALAALLGRGRAKRGRFEGDLEIGQVSGGIDAVESVADIVSRIVGEFNGVRANLPGSLA